MRITLIPCVLFLVCSFAFAQIEQINVRTGPTMCSLCFESARMQIAQMDGVAGVTGDAASSSLQIRLRARKGVSLKQVSDKIAASGLSNPTLNIVAQGKLERRGNRTVFVVPFQAEVFFVSMTADKEQAAARLGSEKANVRVGGNVEFSREGLIVHVQTIQKH